MIIFSTDKKERRYRLTKGRLGDTTALEKKRIILDEQLDVDAKAVNDLIDQNAQVAQSQTEYSERYDALVSRYEETKRRRDEIEDLISLYSITFPADVFEQKNNFN